MREVFFDIDVIIDYLTDRKPFSDSAEELFSLIENKKISAHVSALCFSNLYYLLRQQLSKSKTLLLLKELNRILNVLKVDKDTIDKSLESDFPDFEDAIQYYTALEYKKIDVIVTRNIRHYKKSEISVMAPDAWLEAFRQSDDL